MVPPVAELTRDLIVTLFRLASSCHELKEVHALAGDHLPKTSKDPAWTSSVAFGWGCLAALPSPVLP
jgi:hypothetical protein